jgi:hypothetical protein
VPRHTCLNANCPSHGTSERAAAKFCGECGGPLGRIAVDMPAGTNWLEVLDNGFDLRRLDGQAGQTLYLGCNGVPASGPREFALDEEHHEDLTEIDRAAEIAWFQGRYAKELAKLRAAYDDVVVRWGAHRWSF